MIVKDNMVPVVRKIQELPYGKPFKTLNLPTNGFYVRVNAAGMVVVVGMVSSEDRLVVNLADGKLTQMTDVVQCVLLEATLMVEGYQ
jgi:hypothetical protein